MIRYDPDDFIQLSGPLFEEVQLSGIFNDSKTFVDSIPKQDPDTIRAAFEKQKGEPHFNLKAFIYEHFTLPGDDEADGGIEEASSMEQHIERLWDYLGRRPDSEVPGQSTLIPLPYPYIVPGGRFREIYYWDTYFTAEGLAASGRLETVRHLADNFAHLVNELGHVPNGNRVYYISRSQPPFLVMLADLLYRESGRKGIDSLVPALQKEYAFWMEGAVESRAHRRVVRSGSDGGPVLNRYWDDRPLPREESYLEDHRLRQGLERADTQHIYRHLRAGAESGWDYSSRWFKDGKTLDTIRTTEILPVDLNALLWFMETRLAEWTSDPAYRKAAERRKAAVNTLFWDENSGYYFDRHWPERRLTDTWSLAGAYPLFVGMASEEQARAVAEILEKKFLKPGGLVSTLHETGQQWDYPNGWAPLQWVAVTGLLNYGMDDLAREIAHRWLNLNEQVFNRTGKMMEKYNVCDLSLEAGGGEYPLQDGFGWTNGVAVALKKRVLGGV